MRPLLAALLLVACNREAPQPAVVDRTSALESKVVDPLPSWNAGPTRDAIVEFVQAVTTEGPEFVAPAERIAVFDNDGTLWAEQPAYYQLQFTLDRVRALAPEHPEWQTEQPFAGVLANDLDAVAATGIAGFVKLTLATHTGLTTDEFDHTVSDWLVTARHPRFGRPYTECVYQPMLEVLAYLRANGFKTWIVSGGGQEFMRVFSEQVYGIPPEQVIGTRVKKAWKIRDGVPVIVQQPEVEFIDDKEGKPLGIQAQIGRRPIAAFGNSDGDQQMLEWTAAGPHRHLAALVHHTDATREWAYDRDSHIGRLDSALDEAGTAGWTVIDMKTDWNRVFPFDGPSL